MAQTKVNKHLLTTFECGNVHKLQGVAQVTEEVREKNEFFLVVFVLECWNLFLLIAKA